MQTQPPTAQPLPLFEAEQADQLLRSNAAIPDPTAGAASPDRLETVWYRLFTAIASCYVYVVAHTTPEPCWFVIEPSGRACCLLSNEEQWELALPEAAYRQFETIVMLWRDGWLGDSQQTGSMRPGVIEQRSGGALCVEILPDEDPKRRTQTMAR